MFMEHITVCICTFKRPQLLKRLLEELRFQKTEGRFDYSIVVADNDAEESAKQVVTDFARNSSAEMIYCVEPTPNIALARNKVLSRSRGDYLAFIDDDEFPSEDWLLVLLKTCKTHRVDGVLGPVKPHFEVEPPKWLIKAGFYDRATHDTGFV
jgi:succinoglycan biosynthesis protein ExoM